ncbi:MAG: aminopeptidase P family protein [Anaerolineales bacterium]|nr:aminopeptidase P family protein [Anaerolineales bacterium]
MSDNIQNTYKNRQNHLIKAIQKSGLDGVVVNPSPSLIYLTGLHFHLMERPVLALFTPSMPPVIVMPELEKRKTEGLSYPIQVFAYTEDPQSWAGVFTSAFNQGSPLAHIGIEPLHLRYLEYNFLKTALPQTSIAAAEDIFSGLRICKDEQEVMAMRSAVAVAEKAIRATLPSIKPGVSEIDLASELTIQLLRCGSQSELAFEPIVASGPNSANPHATPTQRKLSHGDLLVIDWGARIDGYISDLTRTFAIGSVDPELARIAKIVKEANAAGRETASPDISAGAIDHATRNVIATAGYGEFFTHRTGHGIGLEAHEEPYIRGNNSLILKPGMTFTVEPGIYLPGRGGVRIEDNVLITLEGADCYSTLDRDLVVLG